MDPSEQSIEYLIAVLIQLLSAITYLMIFAVYSLCFIGMCTYFDAILDDLNAIAMKIDREIINNKKQERNCAEATKQMLDELIQLHSAIHP